MSYELAMNKEVEIIRLIKIFLMVGAATYVIWRVETIVNLLQS